MNLEIQVWVLLWIRALVNSVRIWKEISIMVKSAVSNSIIRIAQKSCVMLPSKVIVCLLSTFSVHPNGFPYNILFKFSPLHPPGFGCDTAAVINILAHRDGTQRTLIQQEYRTMYSEDLLKRLSSELSGKLEVSN